MAVILYSNGLTEDYKPSNLVFTEEELVKLFPGFKEIKTRRLLSIVNTWCVFGDSNDINEFNRIASDIVREAVYSHIVFIHDSEINPSWNATDNILYKGYSEFIFALKKLIDDTAAHVLEEFESNAEYANKVDILPQLITLGATEDKRILFGFNPEDQTKEFYDNEEFYKFSQKVYQFLSLNKQSKEPFTIYADKKAIIIIESPKVKQFLDHLLEQFKRKEDYEICTDISKMMNEWTKINKKLHPPKRKPRKKANETEDKTNGQQ
jgi:hypothetical protein